MAQVIITIALKEQISMKFKEKSVGIFQLMGSLEKFAQKGKPLGNVGGIIIKELKYEKFRFYFITDGHMLKFGTEDELASLLIKFVRMSEKKDQQKMIEEIKEALRSFGFNAF